MEVDPDIRSPALVCPPTPATHGGGAPLGATVFPGGVNFSVYSRNAQRLDLLFFDRAEDGKPSRTIVFDPKRNKSYHYWHVFLPGVEVGRLYGYRAHGPWAPERGQRFDPGKLLLDPYGKAVAVPKGYDRKAAGGPGDNTAVAMKSVVADPRCYNWEGDAPLKMRFSRTVIYEMHVGGFTRHPDSGLLAAKRGCFSGLKEKIPYLRDLGITAVELLPVFQFDEEDGPPGLTNYWGYCPVSLFAPHTGYSSSKDPLGAMDEFRDMVKALHRAGIEVILDVVFNHTAEGNEDGPTFCFKGLANDAYYILESDKSRYANYTGTGNTFNANHPIVRRLILDSLRYWVREMHVDGFRFDLASVLARDETGLPMENPPVLWDIESEPTLAGIKLIAEAWDAGGLYQVGSFVGDSWKEWNGRFRDDVRSFLKGDRDTASRFASRLLASPDIYGRGEREPERSVNFVTCHDGFTLNDLVTYNDKHNEANREQNRDGSDQNLGWNCGVEGPSDDPVVESLRNRQVKNFLAATLLSLGAPMLLMGDEARRTQRGNNNAYCQDNEISWFDWSLVEKHADIHRFARLLIHGHRHRRVIREDEGVSLSQVISQAEAQWHGVLPDRPDWGADSHSVAVSFKSPDRLFAYYLVFNAYWEPLAFQLPENDGIPGGKWRRWIDTFLPSPDDIVSWDDAPFVEGERYTVHDRTVVVLFARESAGGTGAHRERFIIIPTSARSGEKTGGRPWGQGFTHG